MKLWSAFLMDGADNLGLFPMPQKCAKSFTEKCQVLNDQLNERGHGRWYSYFPSGRYCSEMVQVKAGIQWQSSRGECRSSPSRS